LLSYFGLSKVADTTSVPQINNKHINPFLICLPSSDEQRAIAGALSDVDGLIAGLEALIAKKRSLKTATMQQLLTGKTRLPGFGEGVGMKQTELGEIPEDWDIIRLGELAFVTKLAGFEYTNHFNGYKDGGEIIVIRGTNITNNSLDLSDVKYLPRHVSKGLPRSKLNSGDMVFAYVGTIGPVYQIKENDRFHLGPNTAKITVENGLDPTFLFHCFTGVRIKREMIDSISVGAQPSLSMGKIRKFRIGLPLCLDEQEAIAKVLSDFDDMLSILENEISKTKALKQGMMQELLTGRTRLI
jgi:type I restriction enzyme S subunit